MQFCSLSLAELAAWLESQGQPAFRARQLFEWVYRKSASSFDQMTNLSKDLRAKLAETFVFPLIKQVNTIQSDEGETVKFLWELPDGQRVESVLICSEDRRTVCVSCQVGCPARCAFCASGKEGLLRNLTPAEIIEQVLSIHHFLQTRGERVSHVVFMGMGEPMENYEAVVQAIARFNDPECLGISQRRITVSTVGVIEGIERLAGEGLQVNLVLSLHAPNQDLRKKIIPYSRKYELGRILTAMDYYAQKTKRDITYEYTLLAGLNDQVEHAEELATLLAGKQCTVNLIPYNPIEKVRFQRPQKEQIELFRDKLESRGIRTTWRYTKGKDIAAACGQLVMQSKLSLATV